MRRISILGLVAVCAMALAAVLASAAGAATAVTAGNTAFTCVNGGGKANTNADCEPGSTGTSGHVAIKENESTELQLTKLNNPTLKTKIGLATVTLTATGVKCVGCTAHNQTDAKTAVMDVTGSGGAVEFTGVTVSTPNCGAEGLPEGGGPGTPGTITTHKLKLTTLSPTVATLEPVTAPIVTEFNFTGASCPLLPNNPIKIEGHVDGTLTGAKVAFNSVAGMLNIGTQTAFLIGEATVSAKKSTDGSFTPISLTAA